jgi:hypothetical protein
MDRSAQQELDLHVHLLLVPPVMDFLELFPKFLALLEEDCPELSQKLDFLELCLVRHKVV